jgi:fucose 4-O-acetylase-like acetyltransferase
VVYGHNDYQSSLSFYNHTFSLPLFFIASGFVSSTKSHLPFLEVLKKQAKHLLVPYFSLGGLLYLFWLLIGRHYGDKAIHMYDPVDNFIGIFYAQGGAQYMNWGIPMWFLPAMFLVVMIDYFVFKLKFPIGVLVALALPFVGLGINKLLDFHLPWSLDIVLVVYLFYFIGRAFRKMDLSALISGKELLVFAVFLIVNLLLVQKNGLVKIYYGNYGSSLPLMYVNGVLGFIWLFALLKVLPVWKPLSWLGRNTLPILAFHLLVMTFIKGLVLILFHTTLELTSSNAFIFAALQILILVPVILLLKRYLPFLVGIQKKTDSGRPLLRVNE